MGLQNELLDKLVEVGNPSGTITVAPHGHIPLKDKILAIPFSLAPGISGVGGADNTVSGLAAMSALFGGLGLFNGAVTTVLSASARAAGVSGKLTPNNAHIVASTVDTDKLTTALGPAQSLLLAMYNVRS